jgi:hypothetical protein
LVRDLSHLLSQVYPDSPVYNRDEEDETRAFLANTASQAKYNQSLVFRDDANGLGKKDKPNQHYPANKA